MTVLLVLFTFTTFLLIDHFRTRTAVQPVLQVAPAKHETTAPRLQPALVGRLLGAGESPLSPRSHLALSESTNLVRVAWMISPPS